MLKALLWDVDGTLAETERDGHRVAFNRAFAEAGLDWYWDVARYGELLAVTGGRERMIHHLRQRHPDLAENAAWRERIAELHRRKNAIYAGIVRGGGIGLRPGVARLVAEARDAGLLQAIATTTSRDNVVALLHAHRGRLAEDAFAATICGEDVQAKKPDPEVYHRVLDRLGVTADEALAIEDSAAGLRAARAAGIRCLLTRGIYTRMDAVFASGCAPLAMVGDLNTRCEIFPDGACLAYLQELAA